jgi:asparagine synthase (glutamine-hydrolysing)
MCGIAGALSLDGRMVDLEDVHAMCTSMIHRGPDDEGYFSTPQVVLGMRRLSIIDLAGGHQPISNEDGTIHAVLNGEIYNYRELRHDLEQRGHTFRTSSDTETIVHLYEERGEACVDGLRGMFGFAIWDSRKRKLLIARDRLGIKPIYYTMQQGQLYFASELKCLLAVPGIERKVRPQSLDHLLTHLYTPAAESILEGIHKLEPGHLISAQPGREPIISRWWEVKFAPDERRSVQEWEEEIRKVVDESVALHNVADVPVGAFLSGGVDSSSVVASLSRVSNRPVKTFSIGFAEKEFNELDGARIAAKALRTEHRELVVEPASLSVIEEIAWHLDEPFGDSSCIPTYLVSKLAAEDVKVVLSGDGGDELFGGYERYMVEGKERRRIIPGFLKRIFALISARMPPGAYGKRWLRHNSLSEDERYLDATGLFNAGEKSALLSAGVRSALFADAPRAAGKGQKLHWLSALQRRDLEGYLPLDILTKVDRMSMAHSIEARVPLLDHKVVELAATIPPELLIKGGVGKYIFKRAMQDRLPPGFFDRPKKGFAIPLGKWFRGHLGGFVQDLLLSDKARQRGFFEPAEVERLVKQASPREDMGLQVWTLLSFELWCRAFLDKAPVPAHKPRLQDGRSWELTANAI